MDEKKRHKRAFAFFGPLLRPFIKRKFNYTYDPIEVEGNYFLLCNHNLELDPVLLGLAAGQQVYFVASEHIMRKGFGTWFLMRYFHPIIHTKGATGLQTTVSILKALKAGDSVAMYPEGNRSFNGLTGAIFPAGGKLARRSGASLVTYRIEGGYLTQPRWSLSLRKGKLRGKLVHIYSPDELKGMTDAEVNAAIERDLFEDAYATQKREPVAFHGHDLAEGLETTLFACPVCGEIGKLHSHGGRIECACGFGADYDEYGMLHGTDGTDRTVTEWDRWQRQHLAERMGQDVPLFADQVTVLEIEGHEIRATHTGTLTAYRDRFTFGDRTLTRREIEGAAIFSRNVLTVHAGCQYEIRGAEDFSALKYLYLYELMGKEQ